MNTQDTLLFRTAFPKQCPPSGTRGIRYSETKGEFVMVNPDGTEHNIGGAASSHEHTSAQISDATDAATPYMVVKRSASGSAAFDNYISAPTVQAGDTLTVGGMGAVRASNLTGGRNIELPNAGGTLALTNSSTGLVNVDAGYVTGTLPVANGGTGAATAPLARAALGITEYGDPVVTATSKGAAQTAIGIVNMTPAAYTALVVAGTVDATTLYLLTE